MDTARLTAAVSALQEYCEQVRHVMVAKGYPEAHASVDAGVNQRGNRRTEVWLHYGSLARSGCESFDGDNALTEALARAKALDVIHASDCAVHNEPAYPNGPCDCGAAATEG